MMDAEQSRSGIRRRMMFVAPWVPSEQRPRSLGLLKDLCEQFQVTAILMTWSVRDESDVERLRSDFGDDLEIRTVRLSRLGGVLRALLAIVGRAPLQQAFADSPTARRAIRASIRETEPEIAYFNVIRSAQYSDEFTIPKVIDLDEFRSDYYRQLRRLSRNPVWRWIGRVEASRLEQAESRVLHDFSRVLVSSPAELRPQEPKVVLVRSPHALDLDTGNSEIRPSEIELLFVGRLSYRPNREGIKWVVSQVVPRLKPLIGDFRLLVVGRSPGRDVRRLANSQVVIVGPVPAVEPYYSRARVSLVPIRMATGVQMKLIESACVGVPIVTTKISADRAGLSDGVDCIVADTPDDWIAAIERLVRNPDLGETLAGAAREWATKNYGWPVIRASLRSALDGLV